MKELSVEEMAKAYDEAIERAKKLYEQGTITESLNYVFPELKESKNERIRKWLIEMVEEARKANPTNTEHNGNCSDAIAWLEKQGEQKSADKVEPKFHEGDYIVHQGTENVYQVVTVIDNNYQLKYGDNYTIQKYDDVDRHARLWDITKDAKDGDVLAINNNVIVIFKHWSRKPAFSSYCHIKNGIFSVSKEIVPHFWCCEGFNPATKEQYDTLMKAIADAGYTFDFEKRELKKIEQKPAKWKPLGKHLEALAMAVNDEPLDMSVRDDLNDLFKQLKQL